MYDRVGQRFSALKKLPSLIVSIKLHYFPQWEFLQLLLEKFSLAEVEAYADVSEATLLDDIYMQFVSASSIKRTAWDPPAANESSEFSWYEAIKKLHLKDAFESAERHSRLVRDS